MSPPVTKPTQRERLAQLPTSWTTEAENRVSVQPHTECPWHTEQLVQSHSVRALREDWAIISCGLCEDERNGSCGYLWAMTPAGAWVSVYPKETQATFLFCFERDTLCL